MEIRRFKNVRVPGDWEYTIFVGPLQVRIGRSQFAIWWHRGNYRFAELVNRTYGFARPLPAEHF